MRFGLWGQVRRRWGLKGVKTEFAVNVSFALATIYTELMRLPGKSDPASFGSVPARGCPLGLGNSRPVHRSGKEFDHCYIILEY